MSLEEFEHFYCPYCSQSNEIPIDLTGGSNQYFVIDCTVCCAPIAVHVRIRGDQILSVDIKRENE